MVHRESARPRSAGTFGGQGGRLEGERDRGQPRAWAAQAGHSRCFQTEATGHGDQLERWQRMWGT